MDTAAADLASGQKFFESCTLMCAGVLTGLHSAWPKRSTQSSMLFDGFTVTVLGECFALLDLHSQEPGQCASVLQLESFGEPTSHLVNFVLTSATNDDVIHPNPHREQTKIIAAAHRDFVEASTLGCQRS